MITNSKVIFTKFQIPAIYKIQINQQFGLSFLSCSFPLNYRSQQAFNLHSIQSDLNNNNQSAAVANFEESIKTGQEAFEGCRCFIDHFINSDEYFEAKKWFPRLSSMMRSHNKSKVTNVVNNLMKKTLEDNNLEETEYWMLKLKDLKLNKNIDSFNQILKYKFKMNSNADKESLNIIQEINQAGLSPNQNTYQIALSGFADLGRLDICYSLIGELESGSIAKPENYEKLAIATFNYNLLQEINEDTVTQAIRSTELVKQTYNLKNLKFDTYYKFLQKYEYIWNFLGSNNDEKTWFQSRIKILLTRIRRNWKSNKADITQNLLNSYFTLAMLANCDFEVDSGFKFVSKHNLHLEESLILKIRFHLRDEKTNQNFKRVLV